MNIVAQIISTPVRLGLVLVLALASFFAGSIAFPADSYAEKLNMFHTIGSSLAAALLPVGSGTVSPVPSRVIFEEHFGSRLAGDRWVVEGPASYTETVVSTGNDYALKLIGDAKYKNGLRTLWPFERGGNLTVTFKLWHEGAFDYTTVAGPWLSTPSAYAYKDDFPYLHQVEAGMTGQENGAAGKNHIRWGEGSSMWGWKNFDSDFMAAWFSAKGKQGALSVRVQLGDATGAAISWSKDGVTFYDAKGSDGKDINTIGLIAGQKYQESANVVSSSKLVWLGFGGGYRAPIYVDDIVVYRNAIPAGRDVTSIDPKKMLPAAEALAPKGWSYTDTIPATLDLAERLGFAVDGLTNSVVDCPAGSPWYCGGSVYSNLSWSGKVDLSKGVIALANMHARALPLLRAASGNKTNLGTDAGYLSLYLNQSWYNKAGGYKYPYMNHSDALTSLALYNWFVRDNDPAYLTFARFIADGLSKSILWNGTHAFFPPGGLNRTTGVWSQTKSITGIPYTAPDEPVVDQIGNEGTMKWNQAIPMLALALDWGEEANQQALSTAEGIKNFLLKPSLGDKDPKDPSCAKTKADINADWTNYCPDYSTTKTWNGNVPKYPTTVYGTASGQSDSILTSLQGLLSYALATNDAPLKTYVKNGLDHTIRGGIYRLGWVPYWSPAGSWNFDPLYFGHAEVGGLGDLVILEIAATDSGLGNYWDYIDLSVRNALSEAQVTDMNKLQKVAGKENLGKVFGRFTNFALPNKGAASSAGDGDASAALGLYYAWDAIMRYDNYTATVNLALNKAAQWGDVYSSLPYQGNIRYVNKWAREVRIRVPGFVKDLSKVSVQINGAGSSNFKWSGRYVSVSGLQPGTVVSVSFPLAEETWMFNWNDTSYTARIRGSTVISISQDGQGGPTVITEPTYPFYTNGSMESYRASVPQKTVTRFASDRRYPLQFESYIGTYR